jgi:ParB family chromosome partitioning protein
MSDQTQQQKTQGKAKGLGRGLGSLLGTSDDGAFSKTIPARPPLPALRENFVEKSIAPPVTPQPAVAQVPNHLRIWQVAIEKLEPNPKQPRQVFSKEPLQELANSIKEKGIIQPLLVRKMGEDKFEIIAGERRWRAAQIAGLKEVPVLVKETQDQEVLELALIENIQRENLNPIEEAEAYDYLMKKYTLTQLDLAQKVGKDRATVANVLRLLQLNGAVRQMVSNNELSLGQAKVLMSISDPTVQQSMAQKAKNLQLSVRALEKMVVKSKAPATAAITSDDQVLRAKMAATLGEELQKLIGSKVTLDYTEGQGKIAIHFYSEQELNQIADRLRDSWQN